MLKLQNIYKAFGDRLVLNNLNLQINSQEIYGLLGPNGAGKTTTINLICNLLEADKGIIEVNQQPISAQSKKIIGIAPQENLLYQNLTCAENLQFYGRIYGLKKQKIKENITKILTSVNLLDRSKSRVETLSGGMQRRLNMAIALIHEPKLLILDEPTTGLDIETRYEIWDLIESLNDQGISILLTTHLLEEAEHLCQKIGILKAGKIIAEGNLKELQKLIPAQEIVIIKTPEETKAIIKGESLGFIHRHYGKDLAFWLPQYIELKEILAYFEGITIDAVTRQPVGLKHIYIELMQNHA